MIFPSSEGEPRDRGEKRINDNDNEHHKKKKFKADKNRKDHVKPSARAICNYCGRHNHPQDQCKRKQENHPHHNKAGDRIKWEDSKQGKAWKRAGYSFLDRKVELDPKFYKGKEIVACCIE